jgi:uncharacterized protein YbjT (DUF2867 family)
MNKLVTVFGGSGFVGRYIVQRLAKKGIRVRVATRRPNEAIFLKTYGVVGQIEPVLCNIRDEDSVRSVMLGADAVINCVGILESNGKNKFNAVQNLGADRVSRIANELGVSRMVHVSAIGADINSRSEYARTKALGEESVLKNFPLAIILRPSIIFGVEDDFFNRFGAMARLSPVLPIVGGKTRFQPVYVDDVAQAVVLGAVSNIDAGIYELGGPAVASFSELMERMLKEIMRRSLVINLPFWLGAMMGTSFDIIKAVSLGLIKGPITKDQVINLQKDNIVSGDLRTFKDLGIIPTSLEIILSTYLWKFRPSGQFSELK